jgi:penicillin amidase
MTEIRASGYRAVLRPTGTGVVVHADDWVGAAFGLGHQTATDRAGQMDVLRRTARGALAELFGRAALQADIEQRRLGLTEVARRCLDLLPAEQAELVAAFTCGANTSLAASGSDMTWSPVDSISVAQVLFQSMSSDGAELRMTELMRRSLPAAVVDFLLDGADEYATAPDGSPTAEDRVPVPVQELTTLLREPPPADPGDPVVAVGRPLGSNGWALSGPDGAILANDMHLQLTDPALLYAVRLVVGARRVCGVTVPGLPVLIAGGNGHVAWGFTRLHGDNADLCALTPDEFAAAATEREIIAVLGEPPVTVDVVRSAWGPVTGQVAGEPVAFHTTLFEPAALDFGLVRLYETRDVRSAIAVINDCGLPPLNALVADSAGQVGWTVGGRFPRRSGRPGPRGLTRSGAPVGEWLAPDELPKIVNPTSGMVVNCNNGGAAGLAWNVTPGVRAHRVAARLATGGTDAVAMRELQRDLDATYYEFYRDLALRHLPATPKAPVLREIRADVEAWGGTAAAAERGLALLTVFRELLCEELFAAVTRPARRLENEFTYCFAGHEGPLRRLIRAGLIPAPWRGAREFVVGQLLLARTVLHRRTGAERLPRWGDVNRLRLAPMAPYPPDPADIELSGCAHAVCVAEPDFGAAVRLVVDLARPELSTVSLPGGQRAGQDMAAAVADWAAGRAQALFPSADVPAGQETRAVMPGVR